MAGLNLWNAFRSVVFPDSLRPTKFVTRSREIQSLSSMLRKFLNFKPRRPHSTRPPRNFALVAELPCNEKLLAGDKVRLWSRNGRDWSAEFVAITEAMRGLPFKRVMFDGEAVAHCLDGLPDFHRLLGDGQATACFYAFDLL